MSNINLEQAECHIFPIIKKILTCINETKYIFVSGDSVAVRGYTPYKRDLEDIDLIFHKDTDINELKAFILKKMPELIVRDFIELGNSNGFIRAKHKIDFCYEEEDAFIFDFHVGGSVYKGNFACEVDDLFFSKKSLKEVHSFGKFEKIEIPVSTIEEVILFKLKKFIGNDEVDIFSLLSCDFQIDFDYIAQRIEFYNKELIYRNLNALFDNNKIKEEKIERWIYEHKGIPFSDKMERKLKTNLKQLLA